MVEALRAFGQDLSRTYATVDGGRLRKTIGCIRTPGIHAMAVFRFGHRLLGLPLLLRIVLDPVYLVANALVKMAWGIEIPRAAMIGPGLYIGHFGGIIVSSAAVIGENCNISHGVTIGAAGTRQRGGVPRIGNNVYIGPGAKVFGRITIGNNVKIGANCVVHKDVPENAVVALTPGFEIISFKGNLPVSEDVHAESASVHELDVR